MINTYIYIYVYYHITIYTVHLNDISISPHGDLLEARGAAGLRRDHREPGGRVARRAAAPRPPLLLRRRERLVLEGGRGMVVIEEMDL